MLKGNVKFNDITAEGAEALPAAAGTNDASRNGYNPIFLTCCNSYNHVKFIADFSM